MPIDNPDYPPAQHMLRDLRLEFEHGEGESRAWIPAAPHLCAPDGHVRVGVLATLVDALAGGLAAIAATPDWIATADLTLHVARPLAAADLEARGRVLRAGRTTVVIAVDVIVDGTVGATSTLTFSVLARRDGNPVMAPAGVSARTTMAHAASGLNADLYDTFGFRELAPGVVELTPSDYVRNSLGAVQGGALASLVDAATRSVFGDGFATVDVQLCYLALAREGPLRATAAVESRGDSFGSATVTITDRGRDRRTTVARTVAARSGT